ncbi:hypothetical protein HX004_00055 [Myroides sp. 1354]|uniref:hypothetical protein n=1 Tax=unclassified Myroides TaxID=2642485 RepID=UPI0025760FD5|nr:MULTISPECIES: hypothetical protein [unclassified Myroides]MDM1043772.1 hypothetical protein [Myroides sp. R163-1]MDM1054178.1 hypothetical protein [Myroides sp. 1354]MDM1067474.1 hypothetical protein [Myroides sp. 1372]
MFRKIKFILVALVFGVGISSCSSDDSVKTSVPEGEKYLVTVTVSEGSTIDKIMGVVYEGTDMKNDVMDNLKVTEWSKIYYKTEVQKFSFTAQGSGQNEEAKMEIKVTKEGEVVGESYALGQSLISTVVIQADKKKNTK